MTGRPTKLDDLTRKRILDALRAGMSRTAAVASARVSRTAFNNWMRWGRESDGDETYVSFVVDVLEAESKPEREIVDALVDAAKSGNVPAITLWLRSRRRAEWSEKDAAQADNDEATEAEQATDLEVAESVVAALKSRKVG